jgi:hypothetical protein
MSPIDDELRALLSDRASAVPPAPDPLGGIERRAKRMRRNRVAASVAGTALAVAAVALTVPALLPDRDEPAVVATQLPSSAASPSAGALSPAALDPQHPWPYRGDPAVVAGSELVTLRAEWSAKHPGTTLTPLFGQVYEPSAKPEIVFVSTAQGDDRWGVATSSESGWDFRYDEALPFGTKVLMAVLPGDEVPRLLVVAAPSTGDLAYAADGTSFTSMAALAPGVGVHPLEGDTAKDAVRVLDGNGDLDHPVFEGPAPDAGAGSDGAPTSTTPANLLDWPTRGTVAPAVETAVSAGYAKAVAAKPADVELKVLLSGMDGTGRTIVLAQGWVHGNDARNYLWWGSSDGTGGEGLLGKPTDVGPAALVALVPAQGKGVQTLVVVGEPTAAHVGYTSTPTGAFNTVEGGGAVLIDRSTDAPAGDRIRLTDKAGGLLFRSDVQQAVCTTMVCG